MTALDATARLVRPVLLGAVRLRRRRLRGTTFVAVTGSAGKTTTCRLLAATLAPDGDTVLSTGRRSATLQLARAVARLRRRHRFCVLELAAFEPGSLDARLRAYEPDVGVVTTIGDEHVSRFGTRAAIAAEKAKLVAALPATGIAVLNADDPAVRAMAAATRARVILVGRAPEADVRAEDVRTVGAGRLALTLVAADRRLTVETRLRGEIWTTAVLAAVATAHALGVDLERAVAAIGAAEPAPCRLEPLETASGVTFLRDDWKAPAWTVRPALEALAGTGSGRKIAVLGCVSDDRRRPRVLYAALAREARRHADLVVLVGPWAHHGLRAREHEDDGSVVAFDSAPRANAFLRGRLSSGDVVLVKATHDLLHLERIALAGALPVSCARPICRLPIVCDTCRLLVR